MTYKFHGFVTVRDAEHGDPDVITSYGPCGTLEELWHVVTKNHDPVMIDLTIQAEG